MATVYNSEKIKRILQDLIKLTKKSRNIKAIQYVCLLKHFRAKDSQAVFIIKRLHRVTSLGVMWDFYNIRIQKEVRIWLKFVKNLYSLSFRHLHIRTRLKVSMIAPFKKFNLKLFRDIQQRRIRRIAHSPWFESEMIHYYTLDTRCYPVTMREISLDLNKCVIAFDDHVEKLIPMGRFSLLMKLELLFCLELEMALMILKSIPHPQILTSLGLFLKNQFPQSDEEHLCHIYNLIVNKCSSLDKLDLRMTHPTEKLKTFELSNQLKILNLWVSIKTENNIQDLALFLLTFKYLESLDLTIDFDILSKLSKENFHKLYQAIGELSQLKKLHLNFSPCEKVPHHPDFIQYYKIPQTYPLLMKSISSFSQLEDLCLYIPDTESKLKANQFGKALEKVAHKLKRLEMDFYGQSLDVEGDLEFVNILKKMKELRELFIYRFSFKQQKSFLEFKEALESLGKIEKVVLISFEIPLKGGGEALNDLVLFLLMRKGMQELKVKHNWQGNAVRAKKEIPLFDIRKRNPKLKAVNVESPNISYMLYNNNKFESLNYT